MGTGRFDFRGYGAKACIQDLEGCKVDEAIEAITEFDDVMTEEMKVVRVTFEVD